MSEKKPDYTALDSAIVARLKDGPRFSMTLLAGDVLKEAEVLEKAQPQVRGSLSKLGKPAFRFVDTRLQALKKKGVIVFNSKTGWSLK